MIISALINLLLELLRSKYELNFSNACTFPIFKFK